MARKKSALSEEEKRAAWADNQHKAQLINHKEAKMSLKALRAKLMKEMPKLTYSSDWLAQTHGLYIDIRDDGPYVGKIYTAEFCSWPLGGPVHDDDKVHKVRSITHSVTIPLRDYWRLGLQGRGV